MLGIFILSFLLAVGRNILAELHSVYEELYA